MLVLMTYEMHFFENYKSQFVDLHEQMSRIAYAQQSEGSWENFKSLLLLEDTLLMGWRCVAGRQVLLPQKERFVGC